MDATGTQARNRHLMALLSAFLQAGGVAADGSDVEELSRACDIPAAQAYSLLLAASLGLYIDERAEDRALYEAYFPLMLRPLTPGMFAQDPYYAHVRVPEKRTGRWTTRTQTYRPFEAFVCGDLQYTSDGRVIPPIGYFSVPFPYPAVLEDDREWMTVTPCEIATMRPAVDAARGDVLTYGLGLGYFAYMASLKDDVRSVTVVERDASVIRLFERELLGQFPRRDKIHIVRDDAFAFARTRMASGAYDFVFTDLWHDASDGLPLYEQMKACERFADPRSRFMYWIEPTLKWYSDDDAKTL